MTWTHPLASRDLILQAPFLQPWMGAPAWGLLGLSQCVENWGDGEPPQSGTAACGVLPGGLQLSCRKGQDRALLTTHVTGPGPAGPSRVLIL